jgi:hypothetical protein
LLLPACKSLIPTQSEYLAPLRTDSNQLSITGHYRDLGRDYRTSLWNTLNETNPRTENGREETVRISAVRKKRITVGLYLQDSLITSKSFKYRIKGDFIAIHRPTKFDWPIGPLIWTLNTRSFCLARNKEDQLLFVEYGSTTAFLLIMPLTGAAHSPMTKFNSVTK